MKETIDKAETLNVIRSFISSLRPEATGLINDIYDAVNHLPTAQPEVADLISRESAIVRTSKVIPDDGVAYDVKEVLKALPSAQTEQEKGKWIYGEHDTAMCDGYRCDKCGFFVPWDYRFTFIDFINDYNFCPNCGTNMKCDAND